MVVNVLQSQWSVEWSFENYADELECFVSVLTLSLARSLALVLSLPVISEVRFFVLYKVYDQRQYAHTKRRDVILVCHSREVCMIACYQVDGKCIRAHTCVVCWMDSWADRYCRRKTTLDRK